MDEPTKCITIGCSHTRNKFLPVEDRWPEILYKDTGIRFEYLDYSYGGANLLWDLLRLKDHIAQHIIYPENIKYMVIQKPHAIRNAWWDDIHTDCSYPQGMNLSQGRAMSYNKFKQLTASEKELVADKIFDREFNMIKEIRETFSNAKIAYYHYWIDHLTESVIRPELSQINVKLSDAVKELDIEGWNMIIDPTSIIGAYDKRGNVFISKRKIYKAGWTLAWHDSHPGRGHQEAVANKVKEWINRIGL